MSEKQNKVKAQNQEGSAVLSDFDALVRAAQVFLERVDETKDGIVADRILAQNHGIKWMYGDWVKEKEALINEIAKFKK